jgi:hypothetical protein
MRLILKALPLLTTAMYVRLAHASAKTFLVISRRELTAIGTTAIEVARVYPTTPFSDVAEAIVSASPEGVPLPCYVNRWL